MLLHPIPAFCVLQRVIYGAVSVSKQAKANSPEESLQMHHHSVTHVAHPLNTAQNSNPQILAISTLHCCTWPSTLNMEMFWKQNLNIYIRWLQKRAYVLLFILPPFSLYFLCSGCMRVFGEGEKRRTGRLVGTHWKEATF